MEKHNGITVPALNALATMWEGMAQDAYREGNKESSSFSSAKASLARDLIQVLKNESHITVWQEDLASILPNG